MNKARSQNGRRRLSLDPEASKVAMVHTRSMFRRESVPQSPETVGAPLLAGARWARTLVWEEE